MHLVLKDTDRAIGVRKGIFPFITSASGDSVSDMDQGNALASIASGWPKETGIDCTIRHKAPPSASPY